MLKFGQQEVVVVHLNMKVQEMQLVEVVVVEHFLRNNKV
jgi:hypothetical protein